MLRLFRPRALSLVLFFTVPVLACGSIFGDSEFDEGGGASSGGASSSGGFGAGDGDGAASTNTTSGDAALDPDAACAQANAQATLKPVDMFIMFDASISMGPGDCDVGDSVASPWCYAINALSSYLKGASSTGSAAALQFFGQGGGPASSNACTTGAGFDVSVVPGGASGYTALPSSAFDSALDGAGPNQYTPLEAAIRGIVKFTSNPSNRRAGRTTIGVLITDASTPLDCSTNWSTMAGLLQSHTTSTGIKTYVIGMNGANFTNLETLAQGGGGAEHPDVVGAATDACGNGSGPCRHWNAGNGTTGAPLVEALKQIQGLAVGCSFAIPTPEGGGTIDPNQVRVEYRANGTGAPASFARVSDAPGCTASGGWYYDSNANPTTVNLCPSSCKTIQGDGNAKVDVLFGCVRGGSSGGVN
jgi:hypothetical protein